MKSLSDFASEIKLRAERRLGELMKELKESGERRPSGVKSDTKVSQAVTPSLPDMGITRMQSSRWQAIASVPEEQDDSPTEEHRK